MKKSISSKDLILLLLYCSGASGKQCEPIVGRTRIMKMVFLFEKEIRGRFKLAKLIPEASLPDFNAYKFGPYSANVFVDLEFLSDIGFLKISPKAGIELSESEIEEYRYWRSQSPVVDDEVGFREAEEFMLTAVGKEFVEEEFATKLSREQWTALDSFKVRCTSVPLDSILRYVYAKYPEMTENSEIRDKVLSP